MAGIPKTIRSGGPRTAEGRLVSSGNSLKTGAYSAQVALPGEDKDDFLSFEQDFLRDLAPDGIVEASMAHEVAVLAWKKLRLERVEHQLIRDQLNLAPTPQEFYEVGFPTNPDTSWALKHLNAIDATLLAEHESHLAIAETMTEVAGRTKRLSTLATDYPSFYTRLTKLVSTLDDGVPRFVVRFADPGDDVLADERSELESASAKTVSQALTKLIEESEGVVFVHHHLAELAVLKCRITDNRLMRLMESSTASRVHEDLGRMFSRRLKELRTQQAWRINQRTVDVDDNNN